MEVGWGVRGGRGRRDARGPGTEEVDEGFGGREIRQRRMALSEEVEKSVRPSFSFSESRADHDSG